MMLKMGLNPLFVNYAMFDLNLDTIDSAFRYFTRVESMELDDQSYSTKNSVFPLIHLIGNFTVKST